MFRDNFPPFSPKEFSKRLAELKSPRGPDPSALEDIGRCPRGYATINDLYLAAMLDGRRFVRVKRPLDPDDRAILKGMQSNFFKELLTLAQRYDIPKHGFTIIAEDRSCVGGLEYYLRVQVLDGNLKPTIITDGCVHNFQKAPVAFWVSWDPQKEEASARPVLTKSAFNEALRHLRETPLEVLAQVPTPNYLFLCICQAVQRYRDASVEDTYAMTCVDREYSGVYLRSERQYEWVQRNIEALEFTGADDSRTVGVTISADGEEVRFEVEIGRCRNFGWVAAQVDKVTPLRK